MPNLEDRKKEKQVEKKSALKNLKAELRKKYPASGFELIELGDEGTNNLPGVVNMAEISGVKIAVVEKIKKEKIKSPETPQRVPVSIPMEIPEIPILIPEIPIPETKKVPEIKKPETKKPGPLMTEEARKFYEAKDKDGLSLKDFRPEWLLRNVKEYLHRTLELYDVQKLVEEDDGAEKESQRGNDVKKCFLCGKPVIPRIFPFILENGKIDEEKFGVFVKRLTKENENLKAVPALGCGTPNDKKSHAKEIAEIKYYEENGKPVFFTDRNGKRKRLRHMTYAECVQSCEETNGEMAKKRYDAEKHRNDFNRKFAAPEKNWRDR